MDKKTWIFLGIVIVVAAAIFTNGFGITGNAIGSGVGAAGLTIPLSEITEQAKFYDYTVDGTTVSFFVVKAADGSIKTAFDACDVCYSSRKGYRQEGNVMVCNNCGNRYPISGLGTENLRGGGCWPGYLPSKIEGDNLIIKTSDLKKGEYRFK
jgi:uncharacterized membrane protein